LILDPALIRQHFPYLAENVAAVIHARRCGWFSGQQLGMYMLEQAKAGGVELVRGRVDGVTVEGGRVKAVQLSDGRQIGAGAFVNAAGPLVKNVGRMLGVDLPVFSERHEKVAFKDYLGVVPRDAPFIIWADPQKIEWSEEEREMLAESEETAGLLAELPAGAHLRPEGGAEANTVLMLWGYDARPVPETWPLEFDPMFYEVVLRGLATMMPGLKAYLGKAPKVEIDGGYYTKTRENRLLVGPLPVEGAYVIGALSGYGLMAAPAAGELLAAHITGDSLPSYAPAFALSRYDDPAYQKLLERWDEGQL
jgi:glycine/D-amino acid oxidase-like deaminating enzyme